MQAHARCRYVRSAGKLCQTGNPASVDVRDPATMACHDRVGQSGRGRRSHSALSVAYALEFLPGAAIGQRLFGERPSRPCQSHLADFEDDARKNAGAIAQIHGRVRVSRQNGEDIARLERGADSPADRSEGPTSELQALMRISYAVL